MKPEKEILTTEEVAELLKVTEQTVRKVINDGELKAYKKLNKWFVFYDDVVRFIMSGKSSQDGAS